MSAPGAPGPLDARPTTRRQPRALRGRAARPVPALAGRAVRSPLYSRGHRSAVRALRHPPGHLGVYEADLGPLGYFQEPVHVHEPVAGNVKNWRDGR